MRNKKSVIKQIRKVSIGVMSCVLGYTFVLSPMTMAADSSSIGSKAASGNIDYEMLGYTKNKKYNFQDLKFDPENLSKNNTTTEANFKLYGKHNIAASTANWKINLQIDERLAKYITKIEVEPKRLVEGSASSQRIVFQRKNDTLGRSKNIWVANYIRASAGIFAGGETTDTQTAYNGKIYFEKPVKEILADIGDDKLSSDKLFYRIYLTSKKDEDKIVPGIDSTGFFKVQGIDKDNIENAVSVGNDWFKHASVEGRYEKNPVIGSSNGAIVVDYKISKNTNLSYTISAKNKPWNLKYSVDPRLVKYIDGIELYKMEDATAVAPDFSFSGKGNKKVIDLSIDRRPENVKYGTGFFTDSNLTDYVAFTEGSPRPVIIRYVYKLNKPMDQILEELRNEAGVSEGAPFGDDFVFHAWLTDQTVNALIPNTHGVGFYRVQDIDGDGKTDDEEVNSDQSPYIGIPKIKAPYNGDTKVKASVLLNENAGKGNKAQLINKNGEIIATINNLNAEENGVPKTIVKELEFNVNDPSKLGKAGDEIIVRIIPSDPRYTKGEEAKATVKEVPKAVQEAIEIAKDTDLTDDSTIAKSGIANAAKMPEGTKYSWKTTPNTDEIGEKTGVVSVTVPDRDEPFEVTVPVKVVQGFEVTVTNPPKQIEGQEVAPNTKVIEANEDGFTVSGVHDEGNNSGLTIDEKGDLSGMPAGLLWGDKDSNTYEEQNITLHAIVTSEDGTSIKNVEVTVTVQRDTDGDGTPDIIDDDDDGDGFSDTEEIEKGTDPKDPNSIPQIDLVVPPTVGDIENQTVVEGTAITPVTPEVTEGSTVTVEGLGNGLTFEDGTIQGTPSVEWNGAEETKDITITVKAEKDGATTSKSFVVTVQRDTDGDGTPDIIDDDDDGDGFPDTEEIEKGTDPKDPNSKPGEDQTDAQKYTATGGILNKDYGDIATEAEVLGKVTTDAPDEKIKSKIVIGDIPASGKNQAVDVVVTYADNTTDTVKVIVTYGDAKDIYDPAGKDITVEIGEPANAEEGIGNKDQLPENTDYTWKQPIDTNSVGNQTGIIVVTYPDGSQDEVEVQIHVNEKKPEMTDADKYDPKVEKEVIKPGEKPDLTDNVTNLDALPEGTKVEDITPEGTIDTSKPGEYEGTVEVTYPDGSKEEVKIPVIVEKPKEEKPVNDNQKSQTSSDNSQNGKKSGTDDSNNGRTKASSLNIEKVSANAPKTGDTGNVWGLGAALLGSAGVILRRKFRRKQF
ncbi:Rib/alpha-like domain-containing protein [Mediterraneibacter massiliensis]|uniref:Rib/alpha-like domain-containing protein n=1 Tax=Mediterraneibacter massiliensis TaxID=1720300 RepID=UPI00073F19FE|nr:Rib/alpha-like domain-containing protein [Mediterraneibacter massiliensis]